jgi:hypothetical protein
MALDATLLVAASDGDWARLEPVMSRHREQRRVETDRVAVSLDDGALQIVVSDGPTTTLRPAPNVTSAFFTEGPVKVRRSMRKPHAAVVLHLREHGLELEFGPHSPR